MTQLEIRILAYESRFGDDVLAAIGEDPNWEMFTKTEEKQAMYKKMLERAVTFVCYSGSEFCGYIRAVNDQEFAIYISELFVKPKFRNNKIGQKLIEKTKEQYSSITVYALSDEDLYYEKKGYKNVGSVFEI